jgi:hypothetical protein
MYFVAVADVVVPEFNCTAFPNLPAPVVTLTLVPL